MNSDYSALILYVGGIAAIATILVLIVIVVIQQLTIQRKDNKLEAVLDAVTTLLQQLPSQMTDMGERFATKVVPVEAWQTMWTDWQHKTTTATDFVKSLTPDQVDKVVDKVGGGILKIINILSQWTDGKTDDQSAAISLDEVARRAAAHVLDLQQSAKVDPEAEAPKAPWDGGLLRDPAPKNPPADPDPLSVK